MIRLAAILAIAVISSLLLMALVSGYDLVFALHRMRWG